MRRSSAVLAALAAVAAPTAAAPKAPIEGLWKRGHMVISVEPCGSKLCGRVIKASAVQQENARRGSGIQLIGSHIMTDVVPTGPNTYKGKVFIADRNVTIGGTITQVSPNMLSTEGCLLFVMCKTKTWQRVR